MLISLACFTYVDANSELDDSLVQEIPLEGSSSKNPIHGSRKTHCM